MSSTGTKDVRIAPLTANDLEAVIAIDSANSGVSRRGYFEKRLDAAIDRPKDYVYVGLHAGGKLAGFAFARVVDGEFGKPGASATLDAIGVDPAAQGKGYGRKLLDEVESILSHKGVSDLHSQVAWRDRALIGFLGQSGFIMDSRMVLSRPTDEIPPDYPDPEAIEEPLEIDHSSPDSDDFVALARDRVPVRSMKEEDLKSIIKIDTRTTGQERAVYYGRKQNEVLNGSGIRVSLVAELEDYPVGFIMARVDFGEFGRTGKEAVMDTIGVDPGYQGKGVGKALMSQLMANLAVLKVETVHTEVDWNDVDIIAYLSATGFKPAQRITLRRQI